MPLMHEEYSISHTQKIMHYLHEDKCIKHDKPIYTLRDILRKGLGTYCTGNHHHKCKYDKMTVLLHILI